MTEIDTISILQNPEIAENSLDECVILIGHTNPDIIK